MKVYPRKGARVMDPRTMMAVEDGTKVNPKGQETYWYRQELAGDVFKSKEARDAASAVAPKKAETKSEKKAGSK